MKTTNKYQEPEWLNEAIRLYTKENYTYKQIGEIFGADRKTVSNYLRKAGVQSNPKFARKNDPELFRKYDYSVADHIFDVIDTEEKAYWLGFLYADGYISNNSNEIALALQELDLSTVEKFRQFLKLEDKLITTKIRHLSTGDKKSYQFSFNSEVAKIALEKLGCFNAKTEKIKFPTEDQVPNYLIKDFVRGYIDGDGCIYTNNNKIVVEVLGTQEFLEEYKNWVNLGQSKIYKTHSDTVKKVMHSGTYALELLSRVYKNASIYMERKYKKYTDYLAHQEVDHISS